MLAGLVLFLILAQNFTPTSREKALLVNCASNLKQIGIAFKEYASENDGRFSDKNTVSVFELLRETKLDDSKLYTCPASKTVQSAFPGAKLTDRNISFIYIGEHGEKDGPDVPIAMDKLGNHNDFVNVLFADGHVEGISGKFNSYSEIIKMLTERAVKRNKK